MKELNTLLWSFFAAASEIPFRRNKVMVWPARTLSASQSPFPALGIPDFLTSSPGNRRGSAYFLGWPGKGYKTKSWRGKTTCTGSEKRIGGRPLRQVAIQNLNKQAVDQTQGIN
jgi:hypothetical protein